jgi:large subunit ribosomal protein L3
MVGLIGKKIGMTRLFDETGASHPVTVIEAGPCLVTQVKNKDKDGYEAVQLGFGERKEKRATKPLIGHAQKLDQKPFQVLKEIRDFTMDSEEEIKEGLEVKVDLFEVGDEITVTGTSKGKGFAGVVKRHHFGGGPKTHGQSDRYRAPGSIGQSSWPSRVMKGIRMAGRMGGENVTVKGLKVVKVDSENNLLVVKGAVPGANKGIVILGK